MAFAYGVGAHVGFGLGFLNFLGTILFFLFLFMLVKMIFRGMRHGGPRGGWSSRGWGGPRWSRHDHGPSGDRSGHDDEAMTTARERFAEGDLDADAFAGIKQALASDRPSADDGYGPHRHDRALSLARMRLARGEITPEEYDTVRKALNG
jgi:uncharacterized membrane protein